MSSNTIKYINFKTILCIWKASWCTKFSTRATGARLVKRKGTCAFFFFFYYCARCKCGNSSALCFPRKTNISKVNLFSSFPRRSAGFKLRHMFIFTYWIVCENFTSLLNLSWLLAPIVCPPCRVTHLYRTYFSSFNALF